MPTHWIADTKVTLTSAATVFGNISLSIGASSASRVLTANITVGDAATAAGVYGAQMDSALHFVKLRLRPLPGWGALGGVTVNGELASKVVGADLLEIGGANLVEGQMIVVEARYKPYL